MRDTGVPSRTSSGSASTIKEIGRPFQTFSRFALAWRSRSVRLWTYRSHSATRTARWLSGYGASRCRGREDGRAASRRRRDSPR